MYYFLIGISTATISGTESPTLRQMMQNLMHYHWDMKKLKRESVVLTVKNATVMWNNLNIEIQRVDKIEEKLSKEYDQWYTLYKYKDLKSTKEKSKRSNFMSKLGEVFDVIKRAPKRPLQHDLPDRDSKPKKPTLEPDEESLIESTSGIGSRLRSAKEHRVEPSTSDIITFELGDSTPSDDNSQQLNDPNFERYYEREKKKVNFITNHVVSTLDAVGISDYNATRILTAVAQGLGYQLEDLNVSRTTIQRRRAENRQYTSETIKKGYKVNLRRKANRATYFILISKILHTHR